MKYIYFLKGALQYINIISRSHGYGNVTKKANYLKDKPFLNLEYGAILQIQKKLLWGNDNLFSQLTQYKD